MTTSELRYSVYMIITTRPSSSDYYNISLTAVSVTDSELATYVAMHAWIA